MLNDATATMIYNSAILHGTSTRKPQTRPPGWNPSPTYGTNSYQRRSARGPWREVMIHRTHCAGSIEHCAPRWAAHLDSPDARLPLQRPFRPKRSHHQAPSRHEDRGARGRLSRRRPAASAASCSFARYGFVQNLHIPHLQGRGRNAARSVQTVPWYSLGPLLGRRYQAHIPLPIYASLPNFRKGRSCPDALQEAGLHM